MGSIPLFVGIIVTASMALPWPFKRDDTPVDSFGSPSIRYTTFIDTLNAGKEVRITEIERAPIAQAQPAPIQEVGAASVASAGREIANGFRVQCFASSQIENARAEKKNLEAKISQPVYLVFEAPYYKLAVGDCTTRDQASALVAELKKLGYTDSWIVGSKVNATR